MKLNNIVLDMEKTFGTLGFIGDENIIQDGTGRNIRDIGRYYSLTSSVQKVGKVGVIVRNRDKKSFTFGDKLKLVNPNIEALLENKGSGYGVSYLMTADDIEKV